MIKSNHEKELYHNGKYLTANSITVGPCLELFESNNSKNLLLLSSLYYNEVISSNALLSSSLLVNTSNNIGLSNK